jgi:hypothetical protein
VQPGARRDFYPTQCRSKATLGRLQAPTCTGANSEIDREFWIDLTASSAVNFPITRARLRLVVIGTGVRSIHSTYAGARVPPRLTFTTNFVMFPGVTPVPRRNAKRTVNKTAVHFFEIEYSTFVRGLPHSKQRAFSRDVISPQFGHILCDPEAAPGAFALRIPRSTRIVNNTISRPMKMLVAFIKATLLGNFCIGLASRSRPRADVAGLIDFEQVAANGFGRPFTH